MAENKKEGTRDGLALVVGGLFILALVFAAYNYFNNPVTTKDESSDDQKQETVLDKIKNTFLGEDEGDVNGDGAMDEKKEAETMGAEDESSIMEGAEKKLVWVANDYKSGDISGDSYTVKSGDTLWEIAEGIYGNGNDWVKILESNSDQVGFLPNGQQALIMPGQVLVLP
jgi:nucleoid-associated protein YgaU